ncbi:MAG TPA: hypothetical protein DE179_12405 [Oceanospirillaceae bacterium]|nr:hypothetical protein [Oceanospirillaceae bacterium]
MSEVTITYYELLQPAAIEDFWPLGLAAKEALYEQLEDGSISFEDDLVDPIEDWVEDLFVAQYIVQLDLDAFAAAGELETLTQALQQGSVINHGQIDFVSSVAPEGLMAMVAQLMSMHLANWDMDEDLAKEESEIADLVGFLAQCKLRGHALLGVAS